jgi:2-dehydro-3-deoxyphosphogluconate aldolase / (4S)-4-hydroxy-2-oxoglutarate aldolase
MLTLAEVFPNKVAGVLRTDDSQKAFHAAIAAADGGVGTIEITTTVPDWADVIRGLNASGNFPVGVGTVLRADVVAEAKAAGAKFVVTPMVIPEVAAAAQQQDILCVMGALTPTEIYQALAHHKAQMAKIFPIAAVGGVDYLKWLAGPLPGLPLWVSGGVEIEQVGAYLKAGASAVGLTSALFPADAVAAGDAKRITELGRQAVSALSAV